MPGCTHEPSDPTPSLKPYILCVIEPLCKSSTVGSLHTVPYALQVLDLSNNAFISDVGIACLTGLRQLCWLNLSGSNQVRARGRRWKAW